MAHKNRVLRSIETPDGSRCVDLFVRPDGTFGFEEYRRDSEDGRGWFRIGLYGDQAFLNDSDALEKARQSVTWLKDVL